MSPGEIEANARLIAAASDGIEAAEAAYLALLKTPHTLWRAQNQRVFCLLRDFIAKARGQDPETVQNEFEREALK